jgi:outer membrane protein OmpA-like peptidoglycan-associated protein
LGDTINSDEKEMSPFIHADGKTLYFTSNGHIGFGDQDLFVSHLGDDGKWSKPMNLGYPINTPNEERGLFVNSNGDYAYLTSDRENKHNLDIYKFELYEQARPTPSTYVTGIVRDSETKTTLEAKFELIDLESGKTIMNNVSDKETGKYLIILPVNKEYAFNVSKKGYLFNSDNFVLPNNYNTNEPFVKNIDLQQIKIGKEVVLKNIFFELDSYELKSKSKAELNKLIQFLNENTTVKIEIGGHTDNQGSIEHNIILSKNRAKTVYDYLINNNIDSKRLSFKGYGQNTPIATNSTEEGKAKNRRTEFKIIGL